MHTFHRRANDQGIELEIEQFSEGTASVAQAAEVIGCDQAQIARSLAFVADTLVVAVTSGANDVDSRKLATLRGVHTARMAEPDEIESTLGYEVGGVPPFFHDTAVPVYVDESLTAFDRVWAAAGCPDAVFSIAPDRLVEIADGTVADIAR